VVACGKRLGSFKEAVDLLPVLSGESGEEKGR